MNKDHINAYIGLTVTVLFWAANTVIARGVIDNIGPFTLSFWRWLLALAIILPFSVAHVRREWSTLKANKWKLALLALLSVGLYNPILYIAAKFTTATNMSIIGSNLPIVTVVIAAVVLKEIPRRMQIAGVIIAATGILVIITKSSLSDLLALKFSYGDILSVMLLFCWSFYSVLLRKFQIALHPLSLLTATISWGVLFCFPFYIAEEIFMPQAFVSVKMVSIIIFLSIFPSLLGYLYWNKGVMKVGANSAAWFLYLLPVFCFVLAFIFLGEQMYFYHITGSILVFIGLFLALKQ